MGCPNKESNLLTLTLSDWTGYSGKPAAPSSFSSFRDALVGYLAMSYYTSATPGVGIIFPTQNPSVYSSGAWVIQYSVNDCSARNFLSNYDSYAGYSGVMFRGLTPQNLMNLFPWVRAVEWSAMTGFPLAKTVLTSAAGSG